MPSLINDRVRMDDGKITHWTNYYDRLMYHRTRLASYLPSGSNSDRKNLREKSYDGLEIPIGIAITDK
jgi:hypothetical protein